MSDIPRTDLPVSGLYSRFDAATQIAAEAFAARFGANVTATLTIPGRKRSSRWLTPDAPATVEDAINGFAEAMADAFGVERDAIRVTIVFDKDGVGASTPFYHATLTTDGVGDDLPRIVVQAWRDPNAETFVARAPVSRP